MELTKHEFIDEYPYLVYTNEQTLVYSDKTDTSIDDIGGGGGAEWGSPVEVIVTDPNGSVNIFITQTPIGDVDPDTYITFTATLDFAVAVPSGLYCALTAEGTLSFEIDSVAFTDYEVNQAGMYVFQMPVGEYFSITIS